jgi:hypothetical protein
MGEDDTYMANKKLQLGAGRDRGLGAPPIKGPQTGPGKGWLGDQRLRRRNVLGETCSGRPWLWRGRAGRVTGLSVGTKGGLNKAQ